MNDAQSSAAVQASRPIYRSTPVQIAAVVALALPLYTLCWATEPRDYDPFLKPWFDHLVHYGPIGAFAHPFSNYTPAYLYLLAVVSLFHGSMQALSLVKLLSVAGTLFAAYSVGDLLRSCGASRKWAMLAILLPSAVINAALLGQCDALWAGACVLAVSAMIRGRVSASLVWCGVAVAFKAQAVFIAPFIIGALIGHRPPLWKWLIPPATFAAMMAPAWLAGWPAWHLAMIYPSQPAWIPFPGRLANPWMLATIYAPQAAQPYLWVGGAMAALASIGVGMLARTSVRNPRAMLLIALLSSLVLPFLLPKMLERYYFLADLLSLALAIAYTSRSTLLIGVAVQLASFLSLLTYCYFFYRPFPTIIGLLFATIALGLTFMLAWQKAAASTQVDHTQQDRGGSMPSGLRPA